MTRLLATIAAVMFSAAAHAKDYNMGLVAIGTPPGVPIGFASLSLPATFNDTLTFTLGNWPNYAYTGPAWVVVSGENTMISGGGRGGGSLSARRTFIPRAPLLWTVNAMGVKAPARDAKGVLMTFQYTPGHNQFGSIDAWSISSAQLKAGTYEITGITGSDCSGRSCAFAGGANWFASVRGTFAYQPPPPPPPGDDN